jgi:DNA-binding NarL/FixJ family response regulator
MFADDVEEALVRRPDDEVDVVDAVPVLSDPPEALDGLFSGTECRRGRFVDVARRDLVVGHPLSPPRDGSCIAVQGPFRRTAYYDRMALRVLLADPQPFFCAALAASLGADERFEMAGWATDEREAERLALRSRPDVLLCEVSLSPGSGLSLARGLRDRVRVLVVTRDQIGDVILDAVEAGALGCIGHDTSVAELSEAVVNVGAGRFTIDPDRMHAALRRISANRDGRGEEPAALSRLTPREREVLRLLARGLDNEEIGAQLYLSAHTVRTHVGNILRKLGAHSRAEAARVALRVGMAEPGMRVLHIQGPKLESR